MRVLKPFPDNPERAYPSDHRSLPDKRDVVRHYSGLAAEAAEDVQAMWNMEHAVGRAVMRTGEADAVEAYEALGEFENWLNAGKPKLTSLGEYFIFK